ncbi:hypothetical protein A2Z00_01360 [Candidatus Gottesmanbacteria bacterium RBG_13_45_10]|uniref:N-acetyltransferase domain-containing protein n=1 Tax=Candidatus Gottesmanbacteria bacterium RBG_13_45_10 TaxID=1798370 RepID=A0A1F5ZHY5_9BACT|nr:MAG: hypothetical protein A2Z00_01360 [Candidatus Gottesmanbacteria bacterium RBG_13_45_10]
METFKIREKLPSEDIPWDLLLMADPSRKAIQEYLDNSEIYLAFIGDELVGVSVISQEQNNVAELKNIAVHEKHRRKGFGKRLIEHAIELAKSKNAIRIDVGTGNSSGLQLALYQKCGFVICGVEKGFFLKNYKEPIFENGIQCVDMIRLSFDLKNVIKR